MLETSRNLKWDGYFHVNLLYLIMKANDFINIGR
ncbi:MAG: hypothetical protein ACI9UO_001331 [Nitrospinales bacterium]|jgi:hypothetical protein